MKYKVCPYCGSHLDFGERCSCQQEPETAVVVSAGDKKDSPCPKTQGRPTTSPYCITTDFKNQ